MLSSSFIHALLAYTILASFWNIEPASSAHPRRPCQAIDESEPHCLCWLGPVKPVTSLKSLQEESPGVRFSLSNSSFPLGRWQKVSLELQHMTLNNHPRSPSWHHESHNVKSPWVNCDLPHEQNGNLFEGGIKSPIYNGHRLNPLFMAIFAAGLI